MSNIYDKPELGTVIWNRLLCRWELLLTIFVTGLILLGLYVGVFAVSVDKVMRQDIRLFGIGKSYPNGLEFQKSDFLEPDILEELFVSNGLDDFDPEEYTKIVSIEKSTQDLTFINRRYELEAENILKRKEVPGKRGTDSFTELNRLASEKNQAIIDANRNRYTLQINHEKFGISSEAAEILLAAWPRIWEDYVVDNYRVVTDLSLKSMALVRDADLSIPEHAYYANQQLDYIEKNLDKFIRDPRFRRMQSKTGRTPIEVLNGLAEYRSVFFTPLYSSVLSIDTPLSEFYLSERKLRIEELDKQIASLQTVVNDISNMEIGNRGGTKSASDGEPDIIQIGDGTLNDIVGLVKKASLQGFLTNMLRQRHGLVVEKANIEKQLKQISENELLSDQFVTTVTKIFHQIIGEYADFLQQAEERALDSRMKLFMTDTEALIVGNRMHPKILSLLAIPVVILLVSCFVALLVRREEEY